MNRSITAGFSLLFVFGLLVPAAAMAEKEKVTTTPMIMRGKVDPKILAAMRGSLPNAEAKKQFVARQLRLNPAVLGISEPVVLNVRRAQLQVPGMVSITIDGRVSIDLRENKLNIGPNGSVYIHFRPNAMRRTDIYLVSVSIDPVRSLKMSTRHQWGTRFKTELLSLTASPTTLNFVVEPNGTQDAFVQLFADSSWGFHRVEITPVSR